MRTKFIAATILSCLPAMLSSTASAVGEGVEVKITNDGTQDVVVTVYDLNTNNPGGRVVLVNARINGFTSVPISVTGDARGRANVSWTATSTDADSPRCGHDDTMGVGNAAPVNVHADSSCSS